MDVKKCENRTGKKCKIFARRKLIKWKNGINPGKGKISKINPKWTDAQILSKLTELGFYKNSTTTEKSEKKASDSYVEGNLERFLNATFEIQLFVQNTNSTDLITRPTLLKLILRYVVSILGD